MTIEYRQGDLFTTDELYILHGCNSRGVMGSGVARTVRDKFPEAYEEYSAWCSKGFRLGTYLPVASNDKIIINAVTQQNYGRDGKRYVSYDAVADIMYEMNRHYAGCTIAMPRIGAQLGGGDWSVISAIIESELTNVHPIVYVL